MSRRAKSTLPLRFGAVSLSFTPGEGAFYLRNVSLGSATTASTQHRLGLDLGIKTPVISHGDVRAPRRDEITPGLDFSLNTGNL